MRLGMLLFLILVMNGFVLYSGNSFDSVKDTASNVCKSVRTLLPPISMLMLIGAGVVYVGGQFTGAETRSRANVWATNLLIGSLIGLLIAAVAPLALETLMQNAANTTNGYSTFC